MGAMQSQRGAEKASVKRGPRQGGPRICFYPNRTWGLRGLRFQGGPRVGEALGLTWGGDPPSEKDFFFTNATNLGPHCAHMASPPPRAGLRSGAGLHRSP